VLFGESEELLLEDVFELLDCCWSQTRALHRPDNPDSLFHVAASAPSLTSSPPSPVISYFRARLEAFSVMRRIQAARTASCILHRLRPRYHGACTALDICVSSLAWMRSARDQLR